MKINLPTLEQVRNLVKSDYPHITLFDTINSTCYATIELIKKLNPGSQCEVHCVECDKLNQDDLECSK